MFMKQFESDCNEVEAVKEKNNFTDFAQWNDHFF